MNETRNSPLCARASDLLAFLYGEASASEAHDFELHLKECSACRQEIASFGFVRDSITAWRDEALSSFTAASSAVHARRKSAPAALRQFFDLSPLWLKAGTAFALVLFCVLAGLALSQLSNEQQQLPAAPVGPSATYSQEDVDRIVKEALANQEITPRPVETPPIPNLPKPRSARRSDPVAKSRRPLSRAEREQLAADLRLLSSEDDVRLNLLADRINQ